MITEPGGRSTSGELNVGSRSIFADAGFAEISRPTLRRVVMRRLLAVAQGERATSPTSRERSVHHKLPACPRRVSRTPAQGLRPPRTAGSS